MLIVLKTALPLMDSEKTLYRLQWMEYEKWMIQTSCATCQKDGLMVQCDMKTSGIEWRAKKKGK